MKGTGPKPRNEKDTRAFVRIPWVVLDCKAYKGLPRPAQALLLEFARQYKGHNNGKLIATAEYLATRGWNSEDVIDRAKKALVDAGFIFETVKGGRPNRASYFAVTWYALDKLPGYDYGAEEGFVRGAYERTQPQSRRAAPKCRKPTQNEGVTPSGRARRRAIATWYGVTIQAGAPSDGAIWPDFH